MDAPPLSEGPRIAAFAEAVCRHVKGREAGQLVKLRPWQRKLLDETFIYDEEGLWKHRGALWMLPRKASKSLLGSVIALYALLTTRQLGIDVFAAASSRDQARMVFDAAKTMVLIDPSLKARMDRGDIRLLRNEIVVPQFESRFKVVSSDGPRQHGTNPYVAIIDETWAHPNGELSEAFSSGVGARDQSMVLHITTPGFDTDSYLWSQVERGKAGDPSFYMYWNPAPPDVDATDPKVWAEYHPAYGDWISEKAMRAIYGSSQHESEFRRLMLATWTASVEAWLPHGAWDACKVEPVGNRMIGIGEEVALGLDAAPKRDTTALVAATADGRIEVLAHWQATTSDWVLPFAEVEQAVIQATQTYDVRVIAADPYYLADLLQRLESMGHEVMEFRTNTTQRMGPACARFHDAVMGRQVKHNGDPRLAAHLNNAHVKKDRYGVRIVKEHAMSTRHIDLAVAAVIAFEHAATLAPRATPGIYV